MNKEKDGSTVLQCIELKNGWQMRCTDQQTYADARVPGDLYSDLLANGLMEDPYYRDNELAALKLSEKEYEYRLRFSVPESILKKEYVLLRFEGVDTLADIYLNGSWVAYVNNMHRTWEFPVKDKLQSDNELKIIFHSPTEYIREKYAEQVLDGTEDAMNGFPYLRKAHCMFGWDWGPRLPGGGLFRPVKLIGFDKARIEDVYISQQHSENRVELTARVSVSAGDFRLNGTCGCADDFRLNETDSCAGDAGQLQKKIIVKDPDGEIVGAGTDSETIVITDPKLWYPAGYGKQPLYTVTVQLYDGTVLLDVLERRIGLRTMEVSRKKDEYGESFAHCVNGTEIFAMGADYIPEDSLISRTSPERTRRLLEDAIMANFNCIRVWGGGYYPEDWFYDICDELGLIVWQDFMFACAVYDLTDEFEENIMAELTDNIKRIRHHASLGLWCGNNEMEQFVAEGNWVNRPKEKSDYIKMYEYLFPKLVRKLDPQTFYWPASPSSGGDFDEPNSPDRGDVHYWDVWHGGKPFTEYRKFHFRYLSEFGFQSFPAMKTVESFTLPEDRNIFSYVMEKHQRNAGANGKIVQYMSQMYLYPSSLDTFIYASQLLQAQAIRYGVEHFRRWRGRCMGTVIWQLNDCWPVASWSSIDYYGRWKALHYYAKRFFAPVLLSCEEEGILTQNTNPNAQPYDVKKSVRFNVSNETLETKQYSVIWKLADASGNVLREEMTVVTVQPLSAVWLDKTDLPEARLYEDHVFYCLMEDNKVISEGSVLFCPPKYYKFRDPQLTYTIDGDVITVKSGTYAKDVEIRNENEDLVLSDNYFDMEPGEKHIRILRGEPVNIQLRSTFDIK